MKLSQPAPTVESNTFRQQPWGMEEVGNAAPAAQDLQQHYREHCELQCSDSHKTAFHHRGILSTQPNLIHWRWARRIMLAKKKKCSKTYAIGNRSGKTDIKNFSITFLIWGLAHSTLSPFLGNFVLTSKYSPCNLLLFSSLCWFGTFPRDDG